MTKIYNYGLVRNTKGEYSYGFNWIDSDGHTVGFNDVWAKNIKEARSRAKLRESKPRWIHYDIINTKGEVVPSKEWNKGMLIDPKTFKKLDSKTARARDYAGWMLTH